MNRVSIVCKMKKMLVGFDWSVNNDLIASASLDCTIKVWNTTDYSCLRSIQDPQNAQIFCCIFQPINNNLIIVSLTRLTKKNNFAFI